MGVPRVSATEKFHRYDWVEEVGCDVMTVVFYAQPSQRILGFGNLVTLCIVIMIGMPRATLEVGIMHATHFTASVVASYPGLPMFFNVHEKNREGLIDFGDVVDVVCDDTHWNE